MEDGTSYYYSGIPIMNDKKRAFSYTQAPGFPFPPFIDSKSQPEKESRSEFISPITERGKLRHTQCVLNECGEFKCVCRVEFPQASKRCDETLMKMKTGFMAWLDNPDNQCPKNLWRK
jgi:hypothetical protein